MQKPHDELPAQERIIGIAIADGKNATAYLKKGPHWFGVNDAGFSMVDIWTFSKS